LGGLVNRLTQQIGTMTLQTKKRAFGFRALVQTIRNALIHKRKRNGEFQPANWFHVLTWRMDWLNPFTSHTKGYRWISFRHFFISCYLDWEWLRYHTDTAFRLDKKIEKVVNQTISETDWINFYEHSRDGGPGVCYPHTYINVKEEQSEDTYYNWKRDIKRKIYSISETERQYVLACGYLSDFINDYFDESVHFWDHDWRDSNE